MLRTTTKMLIGLSRQSYSSKMLSRQYCHRLIESLDKTAKNKMFSTQPKKPSSSFSIGSALGVLATGSMFAGTGWLLYKYGFKEREIPITGCYVDLSKNDHEGLIVTNKKFKTTGKKLKGDLSGAIVEHIESKKIYLEKGAMDHASLIVEVVIADFLNMVRPNEQPASIVMEEMQESGKARFYTLSEIFPDSMDLEDFVLNKNWKEEFDRIPVVGFGEAIAAKLAFGTELKLANLLITKVKNEKGEERYVVSAIDHEILGEDLFISKIFSTNPTELVYQIRDFHAYDPEENQLRLAGTSLGCEFRNYILDRQLIKPQDIVEFYKKMLAVNPRKIDKLMTALDGGNGVMTDKEHERFKTMIEEAQRHARAFLIANNYIEAPEQRTPTHACSP